MLTLINGTGAPTACLTRRCRLGVAQKNQSLAQGNKPRQKVVSMYVNVMETRVQKEVRDLSRVLAHVLTDCLRGGIPSRLLAATIVPRGHAPVAVRLDGERVTELRRSKQRCANVREMKGRSFKAGSQVLILNPLQAAVVRQAAGS